MMEFSFLSRFWNCKFFFEKFRLISDYEIFVKRICKDGL